MQLLFSEFDNQLRRQRAVAGMKEKVNLGICISKPPQGYDIVKRDGRRMIVVNEVGKKIRKAFEWKARGIKNEEILLKLRAMGVPMHKQQLSKLFRKPFYCGVMNHKMLEGRVIEGTHEKLISKELFLKVNEIHLNTSGNGVPHKKEDNNIPLKVFVKCDDCKEPFTGYIVKAKQLYYYKCRTTGCKCNRSSDKLHKLFLNLLEQYTIKEDSIEPIQFHLEYLYREQNKERTEQEKILKEQTIEVQKNIDAIEESYFIKKDMQRETYEKFLAKYQKEKANIGNEIEKHSGSISNFEKYIENALNLSLKLPQIWSCSTIAVRENLQKLLFPEGIYYNKQNLSFRTGKVNSIFDAIAALAGNTGEIKKGTNYKENHLSPKAETERFELSIELPLYTLSRRAPSATRTRLHF